MLTAFIASAGISSTEFAFGQVLEKWRCRHDEPSALRFHDDARRSRAAQTESPCGLARGQIIEAIQGALISVSVILGIPVLRSRDAEESARLMRYAGRRSRSCVVPSHTAGDSCRKRWREKRLALR